MGNQYQVHIQPQQQTVGNQEYLEEEQKDIVEDNLMPSSSEERIAPEPSKPINAKALLAKVVAETYDNGEDFSDLPRTSYPFQICIFLESGPNLCTDPDRWNFVKMQKKVHQKIRNHQAYRTLQGVSDEEVMRVLKNRAK